MSLVSQRDINMHNRRLCVIVCELPVTAALPSRACFVLLIVAAVAIAGTAVPAAATDSSAAKVQVGKEEGAADIVDRGRHQHYRLLGSPLHARHNRSAPPDSMAPSPAAEAGAKQPRPSSTRVRAAEAGKPPQWPFNYQMAKVSGDIMLGGLMMVHERHEQDTCGRVMWQGGLQATEAMLYTLDEVNRRDIIKGVTLGARIKDDCDRDIYGLEQSFDFIEEYVSRKAGLSGCSEGSSQLIAGVVGASSSVTSIQVANLLKLFSIPQVSFFSTSSELSNKDRYPFFVRTIPSDKNQAEAMVAMVQRLKWTYVSIVYEESSYGEKGKQELERLLAEKNVCIATTASLIKDSGVAAAGAYDKVADILSKVDKDSTAVTARGVIVFASDQEVNQMMQAIRRKNLTGTFSWIGSDGWGARKNAYEGNEPEVEGAITFQPYAEPIVGFEDYFLNLTPETNTRNPWFTEYWEDYFKCRVRGSLDTPYNKNYTTLCRGDERQNTTAGYEPEGQLQFVSNAVMAFAYALRKLQIEFCGEHYRGLCPQWAETNRSGQLLLDRLKNVSFIGLAGGEFHFLPNGDAAPKYRILNFKRTSPTNYSWVTVGTYEDGNNLTIDDSALRFTYHHPKHPSSRCSNPCSYNQAKHYYGKDKCCWMCIPCAEFSYLRSETACEPCENGTLPHPDLTRCVPIPEDYLTYDDSIAVVVMTVAALGVVVTSFVIAVFVRHQATPVVRAAGRELTFVLLGGILGCYLMTFIIISPPSLVTCGVQRFGNGFWFSVCYSALLTKTNRIARIFRAGKRTIKRPNFISPMSQLVICAALVTLQVFIGIAWLLWQPPETTHYYPTRLDNQLVCKSLLGAGSMVGLFYPMALIGVCTVYAVQTRKIPEAFNESKYIGFTMYTTSIIWLAFVAIYFGTVNNIKIRLATTCITMSLSASVALACLFTPKLYIILLRPDRNVRQSMMASKVIATTSTMVKVKTNSSPSSPRLDSCHLSDGDMELHQRLKRSPSVSSGVSRNTIGTQTQQPTGGASNMSTQTLDVPSPAHRIAYMMDIQL